MSKGSVAGVQQVASLPQQRIFICHSSENKNLALQLCDHLEEHGFSCWIAPRDISGGRSYAAAILEGLNEAVAVVVLLSRSAQSSPHVLREIERAVHRRIAVVPLFVENVTLKGDFEYFLSTCQWITLNQANGLLDTFDEVVAALHSNLHHLERVSAHTHSVHTSSTPKLARSSGARARLYIGLLLLLLVLTALIVWFSQTRSYPSESPVPAAPTSGVTVLGPTLRYAWDRPEKTGDNVLYEIARWNEGEHVNFARVAKTSYVEDQLTGEIFWKVRALWTHNGKQYEGRWSSSQRIFHYRDSLERIRKTGELRVGLTTQDADLGDEGLSGYELALLRLFVQDLSRDSSPQREPKLLFQVVPWSESFFKLAHDTQVDVLASGISIVAEREKLFSIRFTEPVMTYPQTLVRRANEPKPFQGRKLTGVRVLAVATGTTNEGLADQLGNSGSLQIERYRGPEVYASMLSDLVSHRVDAVLLDLPYALRWGRFFAQRGQSLERFDITEDVLKGAPLEKIGFVVRPENFRLREAINTFLTSHPDKVRDLQQKYFAGS